MHYSYKDVMTTTNLRLAVGESTFNQAYFGPSFKPMLTIAWNRGAGQTIHLDGAAYPMPANTVVALTMHQTFLFTNPSSLVIWQFDKPFFCVETNDRDVSCIGFLFWGHRSFFTIRIGEPETTQLDLLLTFFINEFQTADNVKPEMLRALLKRLLVTVTQLARRQQLRPDFKNTDLDIVRQFNVLVEKNFRQLHQVQDYADLLNKSPKTLTNLFAIYNNESPLEVIHGRIMLEAKRLLIYTDQPVKEVAYHLGFTDVSHFSRLFKRTYGVSPGEYKLAPERGVVTSDAS